MSHFLGVQLAAANVNVPILPANTENIDMKDDDNKSESSNNKDETAPKVNTVKDDSHRVWGNESVLVHFPDNDQIVVTAPNKEQDYSIGKDNDHCETKESSDIVSDNLITTDTCKCDAEKVNNNVLPALDTISSVVFPKDIFNPCDTAIIENPSNRNEILVIDGEMGRLNIWVYKKKENILVEKVVNLTWLKKDGQMIGADTCGNIHKVKTAKSSNDNNSGRIIVVFLLASGGCLQLCYSIFDCKSYQLVNLSKDTNYIDEFQVTNGANVKNTNSNTEIDCGLGIAMIRVGNYLIFTGSGKMHDYLDILDVKDEMKPTLIHRSKMNTKFKFHGCVRLQYINKKTKKDIRLMLFGGSKSVFCKSIYELKIKVERIARRFASGQQYPRTKTHTRGRTLQSVRVQNLNSEQVEIKIEHKRVTWKYGGIPIAIPDQRWWQFCYDWCDRFSVFNTNNNTKLGTDVEHNKHSEEVKHDNYYNCNSKNNNNYRYLAVFGGYRSNDVTSANKQNQDIIIFDLHKLELYLSNHKLPLKSNMNLLIDGKGPGILYVIGYPSISPVISNSKTTNLSRISKSASLFKFGYDRDVYDSEMVGTDDKINVAVSLFKQLFVFQNINRQQLFWQRWKYMCETEMINAAVLFQIYFGKGACICANVLMSLWAIAQADSSSIPVMSKWLRMDDLMKNIHLIVGRKLKGLSDHDIHLLTRFVGGSTYSIDEFDSGESALLHYVCKYNHHKLLNYLIKHNICNQNNHRSKNKKTGQTCLDIALINSSDECIDILIRKFGCECASILVDIKTSNVQVNALASREVGVLNTYHNNGINWDVPDEKGLRLIDYILKHGNHETMEYVIKNGICLLDYNLLRSAILHDSDQILAQLLTSLLKQAKIESIEFYGQNRIITFEFVFNLFKFCCDKHKQASDDRDKCCKMVKRWLHIITEFHSTSLPCGHDHSKISHHNRNPDGWMCILCLKPIIMSINYGKKNLEYDYCACCDFLICRSCKNIDDYQSKRV